MPACVKLNCLTGLVCAWFGMSACVAQENGAVPQDWNTSIRPILEQHCFSCHGAEKQESELRLDTVAGLSHGGKSGPAIIPGHPDESLLISAIRRTASGLEMPPDEKLPDAVVQALSDWIAQGAKHPDGEIFIPAPTPPFDPVEARKFWAFQPLHVEEIPTDIHSPIDWYVGQKLAESGLQPNPPADRLALIRRASFDLTGLPPTPEEVDAFLSDESSDAFARVVDRLLSSPHYGERWARHWLDVVRYADSNGLDENIAHGNAWRYRNYVIDSLNRDKPFDQFLREQLAGDLLVPADASETVRNEHLTATGFLSLGPKVLAEGDELRMQLDIVDEQIDTIGRSMMGLTLGCARCHDHKFDPVSQADYYALAGIFQSTKTMESLKRIAKWNENSIATAADQAALDAHQMRMATVKSGIDQLLANAASSAGTAEKIPEDQLPEETRNQLASLREELKQLEASVPELPTAMGVVDGQMTNARVLARGNHLSPGRVVPRSIPVVFNTDASFRTPESHSGRLEFAQWLTSEQNPLTARVIANRVWRWHFGRGIVSTADNFGLLGERPTNPRLLDWLAAELRRSGWSLKSLHRKILLSQTWQQSASMENRAVEVDPDNQLFWRWSTRRLEAEAVRDSLLAVAGTLDRSMGTSLLHVKNREFLFDHTSKDLTKYDSLRRSVYLPVIRNNLYDAMSLFDCTDGTVPNGDRASSTVASQALFLMNSPLIMEAAGSLAAAVTKETPHDPRSCGNHLARRVWGRHLTETEWHQMEASLLQLKMQLQQEGLAESESVIQAWAGISQAVLMSNEFLYVR